VVQTESGVRVTAVILGAVVSTTFTVLVKIFPVFPEVSTYI
jgi:hypothetical protein